MTDLIRCAQCKHFEQDKHKEEWGRCAKALGNTIPVLFHPDGDYCDAIWMAVHHDFGCVMGEAKEIKPADLPVSAHD